ncbi:CvfB family protein [Vibrio gallicus]|uniref:CvfB family protein n=1 Tax=Vibrio gallicus TaxID=190897 RepID=UPI0021C312BC|nr:S1-like domain-containing RNA-binding protein [Vibrio gallicus]
MIKVGTINNLKVTQIEEFGVFLDADDYGSVLLPKKQKPAELEVGQYLKVFLYFDSNNELCATRETPVAQVGEWGLMRISSVNSTGAFADWGIEKKDLLVPYGEQRARFSEGQTVLVYVYSDKASGRIVGTTKFNKLLDKTPKHYKTNQQVELIIAERSDLGFKAIVNGEHWGMIFSSDVIGKIFVGKRLKGYVKQVREDGKIDLALQKVGSEKLDDLSDKIMTLLQKKDGFLPVNDKSAPDTIFNLFRASKGTFKKSIGGLYKKGLITIEKDGIHQVK